jgi:hypothetical protein
MARCQSMRNIKAVICAQVVRVQRCNRMRPLRPEPAPTTGQGRMLEYLALQRHILRRLVGCGDGLCFGLGLGSLMVQGKCWVHDQDRFWSGS